MSSGEPSQKAPGPVDSKSPTPGDAPKHIASKVGDKVASSTGVTSGNIAPGKQAVPAGTTLPAADLANPKAKNAGVVFEVCPDIIKLNINQKTNLP